MSKPNVGDVIALKNGKAGTAYGVHETADGVFVQFSPDGELHAFDPVLTGDEDKGPDPEFGHPAETDDTDESEAAPAAEAEPEAKADEAPAETDGDK